MDQKRVPFWEDNRLDGTMVQSWRISGIISKEAKHLQWGKVQPRVNFPATKSLY